MSPSHDVPDATHVTVATLGEPGRRVFLLQAAQDNDVVTLKLEKQQVAALCAYLGEFLADLPSPGHLPDNLELREPINIAFTVGSLTVTYDDVADRLTLICEEVEPVEINEEFSSADAIGQSLARLTITREQAAAVAIRGASLVVAGRPPCPLCGFPLDPAGHACPRTNGHRPPQL